MWSLTLPICTARQAYKVCISRVKNRELRARLNEIVQSVVEASDDFDKAAPHTSLHTLAASDTVDGVVTAAEMSDVYSLRMARAKSSGRAIYDELLASAEFERCPLCGQRSVTTLDHHLPKAYYPALAVAPVNLVPACTDCNRYKRDVVPATAEEETLHPYYDNIEDDSWLYAKVIEGSPAAVRFNVQAPEHWSPLLAIRACRQFDLLRLSTLYAAQAADEISSIRHQLGLLFGRGGADEVQNHLAERAESARLARTNSWKTAAYAAFASSEWFCDGGFSA